MENCTPVILVITNKDYDHEVPTEMTDWKRIYWPQDFSVKIRIGSITDTQLMQLCRRYMASFSFMREAESAETIMEKLTNDDRINEIRQSSVVCLDWSKLQKLAEEINKKYNMPPAPFQVIKNIGAVVIIDGRLDEDFTMRKVLGELCVSEAFSCPDDDYPLKEDQRRDLQIKANSPPSLFYYPPQECAADLLVKRICFILRHHCGRELNTFTDFDFRIYTAKSNILQEQTTERLQARAAGCFHPKFYRNRLILGRIASERVGKYVHTENLDKHIGDLQKDARDNPKKLLLIVADEAHWGMTGKQGANHKIVNAWDDTFPNVIVLLITATPWNLLTENSRIPTVLVANQRPSEGTEADDFVVVVEDKMKRLKDAKTGNIVTESVGPKKNLHLMKWAECYEDRLSKGLVVVFRIPQLSGEQPIWLKVKSGADEHNIHPWIAEKEINMSTRVLLKRDPSNHGHVTITTLDDEMILVTQHKNSSTKLGFVNKTLFLKKSMCKYFKMSMDLGEDVLELQSCHENLGHPQLKYHREKRVVTLAQKPADNVIEELGVIYHSPEFSFLIESQWDFEETRPGSQYLSLNFYYNSMRNVDRVSQLIRDDDEFNQMLKLLKIKPPDRLLAVEYAYYIVMITPIRMFELHSKSLGDLLRNPLHHCGEYTVERGKRLHEMMTHFDEENLSVFIKFKDYIEKNACKRLLDVAKSAGKLKRLSSDANRCIEIGETLTYFLLHGNSEDFIDNLKKFQTIFGDTVNEIETGLGDEFSTFSLLFNNSKENVLSKQSETFRIVDDLIMKELPTDGMMGKMKVIRVKSNAYGNELYKTLVSARKIGSSGKDYFFEIIRYFDNFALSEKSTIKSIRRIWEVLQRNECQFVKARKNERCHCVCYQPQSEGLCCAICLHEHTNVRQFSDLDRLPCIVILVEKGRLGDTFPPSLNVMDLRTRHRSNPPFMSSLIQELGRICRYQDKDNIRSLPYALVGAQVIKILREGHIKGAVFYAAYENKGSKIDPHNGPSKRRKKRPTADNGTRNDNSAPDNEQYENEAETFDFQPGAPSESNYDSANANNHKNRLLFQAEPQIGKTGVFLKTISLLRQTIYSADSTQESADDTVESDEELESSSESADSDDDIQVDGCVTAADWEYPYWDTMARAKKLKTEIAESKYNHLYGPYRYKEPPDYLNCNRETDQRKKTKIAQEAATFVQEPVESQKFAAYNLLEHTSCTGCRSSAFVAHCQIGVADRLVRMSVPHLRRFQPVLDVLHKLRGLDDDCIFPDSSFCSQPTPQLDAFTQSMAENRKILRTWIFNPTYGRVDMATINYYHTMVSLESGQATPCQYVQFLVVRAEEFDAYSIHYQTTHAILELPSDLPDCDVDVREGGIGYARQFIQWFAEKLNRGEIFVIDDNVNLVCAAVTTSDGRNQKIKFVNDRMCFKNVPLYTVLAHLESQFNCGNSPKNAEPYDRQLTCDCKLAPTPLAEDGLHLFTGDIGTYGVLGVLRLRPMTRLFRRGFMRTHVHGLILLNISALSKKCVRYQPWQVHEDCNFNNDCDASGLIVCKYNRFLMSKRQMRTWIPRLYEIPSNLAIRGGDELKTATSVSDIILAWIRAIAPPTRLDIRICSDAGLIDVKHSDVWGVFGVEDPLGQTVSGLLSCTHGKNHLAAFVTASTPAPTSGRLQANDLLSQILEYFCTTPGIGGYGVHVIIMEKSLCVDADLRARDDFKAKVVEAAFDDPSGKVNFRLLASHNVKKFNVPFVLLHIKGRSKYREYLISK